MKIAEAQKRRMSDPDARKSLSVKALGRMRDPEERKKISVATKKAMADPEFREKFRKTVCHPLSNTTRDKMSKSISVALSNPEVKKKMYTPERNEKISRKKLEYWKNHPEEKGRVGNLWRMLKKRDPIKWKARLLSISHSGFEAAWGKKETALERRYYDMLNSEQIEFIPQYELAGKLYDAYLIHEKVLLEFDGTFWHPSSLDECQYEWQKSNFVNDRAKDEIAKTHGLKLVRVREDEPVNSIKGLLVDIYNQ